MIFGSCRLPLGVPLCPLASAQCPQALAGTSADPAQGRPEFQDIVRGTDERPFPAHLPHPAQQELPIATTLLDLAEHRFDNRFAPGIASSPALCPECAAHAIGHRQSHWRSASGDGRYHLAMELAVRRNEAYSPAP